MKKSKFLPLCLTAVLSLIGFSSVFAQEPAAPAADAPKQMSILETILHGGPLIILIWICIVGTSMVMVTLIIQLFLLAREEALAPKALVANLENAIDAGNYQEAWEISSVNKVYLSAVLKGVLERIGRGKEVVENAIIDYGALEAQSLKTKNSYLSVIGVIAPMIGLLGTVIGMMGAFAVLGSSGVSDPRALALRIGEVLMATASGLFIAIPAFVFYYYFRNRIATMIVITDDKINRLIEDVPFSELQGIKIGENFEAAPGGGVPGATQSHKVSMALTTNCPTCNGAIAAGQTPCPHCGATLDWN